MSDTLARKMKQVASLYVTINCKKRGRKFQEAQYKEQHTNEHSTSAKEVAIVWPERRWKV